MQRTLELLGPIGMIAAVVGAQIAAHALAEWPSSPTLWYVNLEFFRAIQYSFDSFSFARQLMADGSTQAFWVVIPLAGLIGIGLAANLRLAIAVAANLSFIYSTLLLYGAYLAGNPVVQSRLDLNGLLSPGCAVALLMMSISFVSSAVSHRSYWRELLS